MGKETVIATLNSHRPELDRLGIAHLYLFGSTARGDRQATSDVDLIAEFKPDARMGFEFFAIQSRLEDMLGCDVDLLKFPVEKPRLRDRIDHEAVRAF